MRIFRVLLATALLAPACKKAEAPEEAPAVPVRVAKVARGDVARAVEVAGDLQPPPGFDVKLAPLQPGRLAQVLVAEGDKVKSGQILARLDGTPLRDAAAQAEAQVAQARAQASNAATKLSRAQQAFTAGVAAGQEVDDAKAADESARATLKTAQAQLSTARNQQERGDLRAPFDGVVAKISAAAGEPVDPSKPVVEVARVQVLELRAPVAAALAMLLRAGQRAVLETDALPGLKFDALVLAVAPVVDATTGAALVRVRVDNKAGTLKANTVAHARVEADVHRGVLVVPHEALVGGAVETVEDGKAKRVDVKVGYEDAGLAEIISGISEGQQVIVQGAYALPDGTRVKAEEPAKDAGPHE